MQSELVAIFYTFCYFYLIGLSFEISRAWKTKYEKIGWSGAAFAGKIGLLYGLYAVVGLVGVGIYALFGNIYSLSIVAALLALLTTNILRNDLNINLKSQLKQVLLYGYWTVKGDSSEGGQHVTNEPEGDTSDEEPEEVAEPDASDTRLYYVGALIYNKGTYLVLFVASLIMVAPLVATLHTGVQFAGILSLVFAVLLGARYPVHQSSDPSTETGTENSGSQKNVVLYFIDDLRRDRVSNFGYKKQTTPTIDSIWDESLVYTDCVAPGTRSPHSIPSMLSGVPASVHEVGANDDIDTIAEELSRHGYTTACISGNPHITKSNFGERYDWFYWKKRGNRYQYSIQRLVTRLLSKLKGEHIPANYFLADADYFAELCKNFISEQSGEERPFYLYAHQMEIHAPFVREFDKVNDFATETGTNFEKGDWQQKYSLDINRDHWYEDHIKNAGYDQTVRNVDRNLQRILDKLRSEGILDETVIVVASDHGELLGERGLWGHPDIPYNILFEIPLLIRDPERNGKQINSSISGAEIPRLLFECLQADISKEMEDQLSTFADIGETHESDLELIDIYTPVQGWIDYHPKKLINFDISEDITEHRMLVGDDWKLHSINGRLRFYEYSDRYLDRPHTVDDVPAKVRERYVQYYNEISEHIEMEANDSETSYQDITDDEVKKQLEDLGYM